MRERLREILQETARREALVTYRQLAEQLELQPPQTIQRVALLLEELMEEDAAAGRPLVAALCISQAGGGLPRRGFFLKAAALGLYAGAAEGEGAAGFHRREVARVFARHARPDDDQRQ